MEGDYQFSESFEHLPRKAPFNGCRKRSPKTSEPAADGYYPLVPNDGLVVYIFPGGSVSAEAKARTAGIARAFCHPFVSVWEAVARHERQLMLAHLRKRHDLTSAWQPSAHIPLIRILDLPTFSPTCEHLGLKLTFPALLIEKEPRERLLFEIAKTLGQILRCANGRHWRLIQQLIEEPLRRWEQSVGKKMTDEARNEKLNALEEEFLSVHAAETAAMVRGWGIEEPSSSNERENSWE